MGLGLRLEELRGWGVWDAGFRPKPPPHSGESNEQLNGNWGLCGLYGPPHHKTPPPLRIHFRKTISIHCWGVVGSAVMAR